jgi:hypothetical protein
MALSYTRAMGHRQAFEPGGLFDFRTSTRFIDRTAFLGKVLADLFGGVPARILPPVPLPSTIRSHSSMVFLR